MEQDKIDVIDTSRFKISPLTADNYFLWSCKIELILRGKGVWDIVSGDEIEPIEEAKKEKFFRRRDTALSLILFTIDDSCIAPVIKMRNPNTVWETLKSLFEKVSEVRTDAYLTQLQLLKMKDDEKVMELVNRQTSLVNRLVAVGHTVSAEEKRRTFLRALRDEFKIAVQVIRSSGKSFEDAVADLVTVEAEQDMEESVFDSNSQALNVKIHNGCEICGVPLPKWIKPHTTNQCFYNSRSQNYKPHLLKKRSNRKQTEKRGYYRQSDKGTELAAVARGNQSNNKKNPLAYVDFSFVTQYHSALGIDLQVKSKWFIDSGASRHMCNDMQMFATFVPKQKHSPVSVGNGETTIVKAEGTVLVHETISGLKLVIALMKVLYVPDLMCNLISVSKMRKSGCRITFDNDSSGRGTCEVVAKESKNTQLMAIEREMGLYEAVIKPFVPTDHLKPRAMIGTVDRQKIWHNRLGHISDSTLRRVYQWLKV